jgi:plasmid stabilization system protein ParE
LIDVVWSDEALVNLGIAMTAIGERSPRAASRFADRVTKATLQLADFPRSGRTIPSLGIDALRELLVERTRIVYVVEPERVYVLAVQALAR